MDATLNELSRNLRVDSVSRLELSPPVTAESATLVAAAVERMREHRCGCLLVTENGQLVGIFTERDLLVRLLAPGRSLDTPLHAVMTTPVVTVEAATPIQTAIQRMQQGGYRHLPVVDGAGRPVGILSARHLLRYIVEHFPAVIFNQPPDPKQFPAEPEGA